MAARAVTALQGEVRESDERSTKTAPDPFTVLFSARYSDLEAIETIRREPMRVVIGS
jgi:hypothetical protein